MKAKKISDRKIRSHSKIQNTKNQKSKIKNNTKINKNKTISLVLLNKVKLYRFFKFFTILLILFIVLSLSLDYVKEVGIKKFNLFVQMENNNPINIFNNTNNISQKIEEKNINHFLNKNTNKQYQYVGQDRKNLHRKVANLNQPKLAIIMDDIYSKEQVEQIKALKIPITPSFFPPYDKYKHINYLTKDFSVYMVHLPLEAINYKNTKQKTLKVGASKNEINSYIAYIKKYFNNVKFMNNHTGSAFTSDYASSLRLFEVLNDYNIKFIDSLTASNSKIPDITSALNLPYVFRDVFLDNEQDIKKIIESLQIAISIAKKYGVAIAICHPYKATFKALEIAQNTLFDGVEVVYVDQVYGLYK